MYWGDRRPAEVAAARVTTPDEVAKWADVRRGYVSFAYSGKLTPEQAERVADGEALGAPWPEGTITIAHFPSLAWWTR